MSQDILSFENRKGLINLLKATGKCSKTEDRFALLQEIGFDPDDFPGNVGAGGASTFATTLVNHLSRTEDLEALANLVETVAGPLPPNADLPQTPKDTDRIVSELRAALKPQRVHIITGTKGGVGKTLVALAMACYYHSGAFDNRSLLCADMNTTNSDLFRILTYYSNRPRPLQSWSSAVVDHKVHAIRRAEPHVVKGGAASFWSDVLEITTLPQYDASQYDILIDTCLHISNIVEGRPPIAVDTLLSQVESSMPANILPYLEDFLSQLPADLCTDWEDIVREILIYPGRTIYIWIFWTWANFQDAEIGPIDKAIAMLHERFGTRINIIHVLNPSALMEPKANLPPTAKDLLDDIRELQVKIDAVHEKYGVERPKYTKDMVEQYEQGIMRTWQEIEDLPEHSPDAIPDLYRLARSEVGRSIAYRASQEFDFRSGVSRLFAYSSQSPKKPEEVFKELLTKLTDQMSGRPRNLLAISTLNPKLIGYTEMFAQTRPENMSKLKEQLDCIIQDIGYFLPHVEPSILIK